MSHSQTVIKKDLYPFQFDATHCPDLFPPLLVLAAACSGISRIKGTNRLLHKESNRLSTLIDTFHRLGVNLGCQGDELLVHGTGRVKSNKVHAHKDHRIAMAAAISGSLADGPIEIDEPAVVNKSYPQFFEDLDSCIITKT